MTEYNKNWILYDGECRVCVGLKKRLARIFEKRGFSWEPLQADWVSEAPNEPAETADVRARTAMTPPKTFVGARNIVRACMGLAPVLVGAISRFRWPAIGRRSRIDEVSLIPILVPGRVPWDIS